MTDPNDYKVGYGKPPKHSRFAPGVSGNPKGKPRKDKSFEEDVKAVLSSLVQIEIKGKKTYVTKRQLLLEQIINGAINKNPTMMRLALPLLRLSDGAPDFEPLPEDQKAFENLMKNFNSDGSL